MAGQWSEYFYYPQVQLLLWVLMALMAGALAAKLLTRLLARFASSTRLPAELAQRIAPPVHFLVPTMAIKLALNHDFGGVEVAEPIEHLLVLLVIIGLTWLGLRGVDSIQRLIAFQHPVDISDNLRARKIQTQTKVLVRTLGVLVFTIGLATAMMTFPSIRQFGASLLASAGVAGLAIGFAAKPVLGNLIAGLQIALTQPIRLDDVVIIQNEWGRIEEITGAYVVVRIWDNRRLVVPLQWIIENPFQNWTRQTSTILGSVFLWVDYALPLAPVREEFERLCGEVPHLWDGEVCVLQVTDCNKRAIQLRALTSSPDSARAWDLRCYLRENLIHFIGQQYPQSLPRLRASINERHPSQSISAADQYQGTGTVERQPPV